MPSNRPSSPNPLRRALSRSILQFKTPPPTTVPTSTPSSPSHQTQLFGAPKRRLSLTRRRPSSSRSRGQDDDGGIENHHPDRTNILKSSHSQEYLKSKAYQSNVELSSQSRLSLIQEFSSSPGHLHHGSRQSRSSNIRERPSTPFNLFLSNSSSGNSSNLSLHQHPIGSSERNHSRKFSAMSTSSSQSRPSTPSLLPAWNEFWHGNSNMESTSVQYRPRKLQRKGSDESFFCRGISNDVDELSGNDIRVPIEDGNSLWLTDPAASKVSLPRPPPRPARPHSFGLLWDDEEALADELNFDNYRIETNESCKKELPAPRSISPTQSLYSLSTVSSSLSLDAYSCPSPTSSCFPSSPKEWFESYPPSPPATIRLNLNFSKTSHHHPATGLQDSQVLLISNSASILDLKELIVKRLSSKGIAFSPNELSLGIQISSQQPLTTSNLEHQALLTSAMSPRSRAVALMDKVRGRRSSSSSSPSSPISPVFSQIQLKELDNDRLICEEGLIEDDEILVGLKTRTLIWI